MAADYYHTYKPYIKDTIHISNRNVIEVAHLLKFRYKGNQDEVNPELVLVLNPNYLQRMHGVKLNELEVFKFKALMHKITTKLPLDDELGELTIPTDMYKLPIISEIRQPNKFYKSYIKNDIRFRLKPPIYRTYNVRKMFNMEVVFLNYKKLGLEANFNQDAIDLFPMLSTLND